MRKVVAATNINSNPELIIAAFTEQELLKGWWNVERSLIEKKAGGVYTLAWNVSESGFGYVSTGTIKSYKADKFLIVENMVYLNPARPLLGPMTLSVETKITGESTELNISQDGYQEGPDWDWYYEAVKGAWPMAVQMLKEYLERNSNHEFNQNNR